MKATVVSGSDCSAGLMHRCIWLLLVAEGCGNHGKEILCAQQQAKESAALVHGSQSNDIACVQLVARDHSGF